MLPVDAVTQLLERSQLWQYDLVPTDVFAAYAPDSVHVCIYAET